MQKTVILTLALAFSSVSHAATCDANIARVAPDSRYQTLNNGSEVKDLQTNLIWQRCSLGQSWGGSSCSGSANTYAWQDAMVAASSQKSSGWRLPNIKELQTLVEEACESPSINETLLPIATTDAMYFSSSPVAKFATAAWVLNFKKGIAFFNPDNKSELKYVRLVRE